MPQLNNEKAVYMGGTLVERAYLAGTAVPLGLLKRGTGQIHTSGSYTAYTSMWGAAIPQNDTMTYTVDMRILPSVFPANTSFRWSVTPDPDWGGVNGYVYVAHGNYDWTPGTHVSRQVYTVTDLTVNQDWTYSGDAASGLLSECWLTSTSHPSGDLTDKVYEVAYLPKVSTPGASFLASSTVVGSGSFTDTNGVVWNVRENLSATNEPYFMAYRPGYASYTGPLSFKDLFAFLINAGKISGDEWYNGIALGAEPHSGTGSVTINSFGVLYTGTARVPWTVTTLVATTQSSSQINLTWRRAAGATSHQYRVNGGAWTTTSSASSQNVTGLSAATSYTFEVRGVNATGNGATSNSASATTQSVGATNVIVNGQFVDDSNWNGSWYSGKTISGGEANFTNSPAYDDFNQDVSLTSGKYYELTWTISNWSSGNVFPLLTGGTNRNGLIRSANGTYSERLLVNAGNNRFAFMMETGGTLSVTNISLSGPYNTSTVGGS